ncbi:MAG: alpha/beta hydrolase [Microthrixaceae bacterium]
MELLELWNGPGSSDTGYGAARKRLNHNARLRAPNDRTPEPCQTPGMDIDSWQSLGSRVGIGDDSVFLIDAPATDREDDSPVLVIHGFPTSSIDWAPVLGELRRHRRVVLPDLPGFGLSDKPDRPYSIAGSADAIEGVLSHLHLVELDLVTHDMGDTVGGELLAR